jgi:trk system potassium uptake protein TrkA
VHAVILGCGRVGSAISVDLAKAGHSVAVIDKRADAFDRLPPGFEAQTIVGVGFDRDVLEKAGITKAAEDGAFIAVTNGDNSNIVSARIAREHYHVKRVIARIYDPRRAEIYEKLNIPTVASARWAASQIQFLLFHGKEELKESFAGGTLLHLQRNIPDHLVGKPASSVEVAGSVRIVGVDRGGKGFLPVEGSTFQQGDVAHFIVTTEGLAKLDVLMVPVAE